MSDIKLQKNIETELEKEDYFNTKLKADLIKSFIESYSSTLEESKMIALYGEWGSGKSSVLKYIKNKLGDSSFKTIFFNTWEYENDINLSISLFDAIYSELETENKEIKKSAYKVLKSLVKSTTLNLWGLSVDGNNLIEDIENSTRTTSYFDEVTKFKEEFKKMEDSFLKENQTLVVFIDDLDRCEPDKVLNLLSMVKLFFTLGKRMIFVAAIDKEAVAKALMIKYNDVIKANEYLEKIFDFSFNMPDNIQLENGLKVIFNDYKDIENFNEIIKILSDFFTAIGFTNPRHLKKVINRYFITQYFNNKTEYIENKIIEEKIKYLKFEKKNLYVILVYFYLIVLKEFKPENYKNLLNYENKINSMIKIHLRNKYDVKMDKTAMDQMELDETDYNQKIYYKISDFVLKNGDNKNLNKNIILFMGNVRENFYFNDITKDDTILLRNNFYEYSSTIEYKFCNFMFVDGNAVEIGNVSDSNNNEITINLEELIFIIETLS